MTRTEALLANVLDNPEDDLARFAFADYVIEYDADNAPALARAELVVAMKNKRDADARARELFPPDCSSHDAPAEAHKAAQAFELALRNPALVLVPGCRADGSTLYAHSLTLPFVTYDVRNALRLGFVEHIWITPWQLPLQPDAVTIAGIHTAFANNPIRKVDVILPYSIVLRVEIDRIRHDPANDGWQVYFYRTSATGARYVDYLCMYSHSDRDEMVESLPLSIASVLLDHYAEHLSESLRLSLSRRLFPHTSRYSHARPPAVDRG